MKFISRKSRLLIAILILSAIAISALLSSPGAIQAQGAATSTPAFTPTPDSGDIVLVSGNTRGLMWGAGLILVIVLGGVAIQRILLRSTFPGQGKSDQS